jgi:hypothetical protein
LKWFSEAPEILLERRPILLVDDEADQASINVGSGRRSTINRLILQILDRPKAAYVAYTATPFANMLIDPSDDDLYPDDFIAALPRPADYFGPETLFGRQPLTEDEAAEDFDGLGIVCHVDDQDAAQVRPPRRRADRGSWSPSVPKSLRQAIIWFVLATAARRTRGPAEHSSMLVHTTMYTDAHEALGEAVRTDVRALLRGWEEADKGIFHEISVVWRDLVRPDLTTQFSLPGLNYEEVRGRISEVLAETEVVVDNYRSEQRLSYPDDRHVTVIAIGGNTLSRGLTLEGLVVSYFVRAASAYDTLMQMGRWFGFRRGYADLPRVWLTPDLEDFFIRLATVEAEVRADVERYRLEQKTPRDFAVRIRTIPGLAVTSRAKMRSHKKLHVSYANQRKQTFLFDHRNLETLEANLDAARTLIHEAGEANTVFRKREGRPGWWLARDVPWAHLRGFLAAYRFHPEQADLNADAIIRFVEKQTDLGGITTWNVAVAGLEGAPNGSLPLGLPDEIGLLIRAKLNIPGLPHANIKSLMTTIDRVIDLPDRDDEAKDIMAGVDGGEGRRETRLAGLRPEGVGLVVIYPIQAESAPRELSKIKRKSPRTRLDAATDVIGVGLVFPRCTGTDHEAVEYVVAFDEPLDMEDADELSEEEAQLADARDAEALAREDEEAGGSER